ncbi:carbohydrate kinase family protein [Acidipropionibacterium virtanenii]|uniref:Sulfofructose kinase n=1 Tax=Acidipropionibacterium virtanenii TaxID=2057246 RepID=A0A344UQZ4_9ACTN|nr:carbohydrate kinase family protein [Acidipropionibacterium virtanenii]AXE37692.1 Sulfofructose kinase [Acidipropionibacterium virtanenii]
MSNNVVVTCVGVITLDVIAMVRAFPQQEGRMEAEDVIVTGGGPASNAAVALARQGVSTAVVGRVGHDEAGDQALTLLDHAGVDTTGVVVDESVKTQTSCIIVDQSASTRSIVTTRSNPLNSLTPLAQERITASEWVHVDHMGYRAVTDLIKHRVSGHRPLISIDSGNAPIEGFDPADVDLYVPTAKTLLEWSGINDLDTAARRALARGAHAVVATDGANGCSAWWDGEGAGFAGSGTDQPGSASAPAFAQPSDIVSTLGAGDVFHGGLLSALVHGVSWADALVQANITAGLSCHGRDGREAVPVWPQVEAQAAAILH